MRQGACGFTHSQHTLMLSFLRTSHCQKDSHSATQKDSHCLSYLEHISSQLQLNPQPMFSTAPSVEVEKTDTRKSKGSSFAKILTKIANKCKRILHPSKKASSSAVNDQFNNTDEVHVQQLVVAAEEKPTDLFDYSELADFILFWGKFDFAPFVSYPHSDSFANPSSLSDACVALTTRSRKADNFFETFDFEDYELLFDIDHHARLKLCAERRAAQKALEARHAEKRAAKAAAAANKAVSSHGRVTHFSAIFSIPGLAEEIKAKREARAAKIAARHPKGAKCRFDCCCPRIAWTNRSNDY